jgi:hypothetical protein
MFIAISLNIPLSELPFNKTRKYELDKTIHKFDTLKIQSAEDVLEDNLSLKKWGHF